MDYSIRIATASKTSAAHRSHCVDFQLSQGVEGYDES